MFARPDTPGVYIQPVDADRGRLAALRTDIPGFTGIAERGPVGVPVAIRSMRQFESIFGGYIGAGYLAYVVRAFFENGGTKCRVVRVAAVEASAASKRILIAGGRYGLTLSANSAGQWGNALTILLVPNRRGETQGLSGGDARATPVPTTEGFTTGQLVRITQGPNEIWRVAAHVDPVERKLFWTHPDPERRHADEAPLAGIAIDQPFRIEAVVLDLTVQEGGRLIAVYPGLSPVPRSAAFAPAILCLPVAMQQLVSDEVTLDDHGAAPPPVVAQIDLNPGADWLAVPMLAQAGARIALTGGRDGLTHLSRHDFIQAIQSFEAVGEVAMLACPDIHIQPVRVLRDPLPAPRIDPCEPCRIPDFVAPPLAAPDPELPPVFGLEDIHSVQAEMIDQCERLRDRVAIIDPPFATASHGALGLGPVRAWRSRFDTAFGALYFPWLTVADPLARAGMRSVPPSGHIAGQFAATDAAGGVHTAAADTPLRWVQNASAAVNVAGHGLLNSENINVVALREGRPLRIMGARTLSSDPVWQFVPVRRLVCMLRDILDAGTQWAVFEPNNDFTRMLMQENISALLMRLWRGGALAGLTPEQAFQVRCDETNNGPDTRANGRFHVDILIAPTTPFEFIVLRIGRQANQYELVEDGALRGAMVGGIN
jgi:uncharacterized protein